MATTRKPSRAEQVRAITRRATCFHEAGHAVVNAAVGFETASVTALRRGNVAGIALYSASTIERGMLPHDSHRVGQMVASAMAGYLAERRFLLGVELPPGVRAPRVFSLAGAAGDLASIERRNPFSRVSELTGWHDQARALSWRTAADWSGFVLAWTRLSGRLLRQRWAHVEALAGALLATRGALRGPALQRLLDAVPLHAEPDPWAPEWLVAECAQQIARLEAAS